MEGIRNGKSSPVHKRQKVPCFASNRSSMESMIDSRNIHMVDTAVGSQPGRSTNDTRPRFRPKRALSCPSLPMAKGVPVMRNQLGIPCSPGRRPQDVGVGASWSYAQALFPGGDGDYLCDSPEIARSSVPTGRRQRPQGPPPTWNPGCARCQRQLDSEHFRRFKIYTPSVDGNSANAN